MCVKIDELYDIFIRIYSRCLQIELQSYLLNIKLTKNNNLKPATATQQTNIVYY